MTVTPSDFIRRGEAEVEARAQDIFDALGEQTDMVAANTYTARETADRYVRQTVLFAMALFLIAIAQRFEYRGVRIAVVSLAGGVALLASIGVIGLPRI